MPANTKSRLHLPTEGWRMHPVGGRELPRVKRDRFIADESFQGQTSRDDAFGDALEAGGVSERLGAERMPLIEFPAQQPQNPERFTDVLG